METDELLLSVIIPVYNGEKYIEQTIKSVLNQPCKNVELIIVNDGSNDKSAAICKKLENEYKNIRYFEKINEGIGKTRNWGLKYAKGKYVNFLDQDDVWIEGVFNSNVATVLKESIDVVGFSMWSTNERITRGKYHCVPDKDVFGGGLNAVLSSWIHHSSFMFRRELLTKYNLKYPSTRHEDIIFRHMCLYVSEHIHYIDVPLFFYRNNPGSETHREYDVEKIFGPLLQSYDELIRWHENNYPYDLESIKFCKRMKCIYSIEAIEILYKKGATENKTVEVREKICPDLLKEYKSLGVSQNVYSRIYEYENKRDRFRIKNRLKGTVLKLGQIILKCSFTRKVYEIKKYPERISKNI